MNWKAIGKHVFLSPIYAFVVAGLGCIVYGICLIVYGFFLWLFSEWFNFLIAIGVVWAFALVSYILYKADPGFFYD